MKTKRATFSNIPSSNGRNLEARARDHGERSRFNASLGTAQSRLVREKLQLFLRPFCLFHSLSLSLSLSVESTRETSDESSIRQRRALFRPPGPLSKEVKRYARWNKEGKREREREIECFEVERYGKFYRFAIAFHHFRGSTFVRCDRDDEGRDRDARESPAT